MSALCCRTKFLKTSEKRGGNAVVEVPGSYGSSPVSGRCPCFPFIQHGRELGSATRGGTAPGGRLRGRGRALRRGALPGRPRHPWDVAPAAAGGITALPSRGEFRARRRCPTGLAPERPERSGLEPPRPSCPGFPELSWLGAAPGEVPPGVMGWGLPQVPHRGRREARLRGSAQRPAGGAVYTR